MRNKQILLLLVGFIIIHFSCSKTIETPDCTVYSTPKDAYVYPIKPGSTAWLALGTTDARVKASQIPDSVLSGMSSAALIQSWLDFPFHNDLILSNSLQYAIEFWLANFSGLIELQKRPDAGKKIMERYLTMDPSCIRNLYTDGTKKVFALDFISIQFLLAQNTFINNLTVDDRKIAVWGSVKKYLVEKAMPEFYEQVNLASCLFVSAKIMNNAHYSPFVEALNGSAILKQFMATGRFPPNIFDTHYDIQLLVKLSSEYSK